MEQKKCASIPNDKPRGIQRTYGGEKMDKIGVRQATKDGVIVMSVPGVCDLSYPTSTKRRGRVQGGGKISPTITTTSGICKIIKVKKEQ